MSFIEKLAEIQGTYSREINIAYRIDQEWVPRGGVDLAEAFLSEGPWFEPCRQLWKKLIQDESSDSHNREWDESARTNRGLA